MRGIFGKSNMIDDTHTYVYNTPEVLMGETLDRFQLLWPKRQRAALTRLAKTRGLTLTEMTRRAIELGIHHLEHEDEFAQRERVLEQAARLRARILARNDGKPLNIDVAGDLRQMREERVELLAGGH